MSRAPKNILSKDAAAASTAAPATGTTAVAAPAAKAQCTLERAASAEKVPQNVGEHLTLTCQGDFGSALGASAQVSAADGHEYALFILKVLDSSPQSFKAVVTSYRAGPHDNETFTISDGKVAIETSPLAFKVESVIQPKQGEPPKPFPSFGPFEMSYPIWLWFAIAAAILFVCFGIAWTIWRRQKRKKLLAELEKHMTMLPPFGQFSKDARASVKRLGPALSNSEAEQLVKKIDEDFRLYLIRELKVPALQVSNREIIREIRRSHPQVYHEYQGDLRRVLFELERANRDTSVKTKDCEELLFLSRKLADQIYTVKRRPK